MDNTITEHDLDPAAQQFVQGFRESGDSEPDLAVDGLTESIVVRLIRLLGFGRF